MREEGENGPTERATDRRADPGPRQPRPPRPDPSADPGAPTARPRGASPRPGAPRGHSPARGRPGAAAPPSRFIVLPRPPAGKGTGGASRRRSCAAPAGICSSGVLNARRAASRAAPQKLRLPAPPTSQGGIGSFRITLCCRSESDWLFVAVARDDVRWPVAKGGSFAHRGGEARSVSAVRGGGTSVRMAQSQWCPFYKSLSHALCLSFGSTAGEVHFFP